MVLKKNGGPVTRESLDLGKPLVSIIVITYNSSKYVLETLESAKAQTYQNIELIVTDDCSNDDTVKVCRNWVEENRGRFVRTEVITVPENTGIPANCNRGVKAAKGEWVKLIAGDDVLKPELVTEAITFLRANSCDILFFGLDLINENSHIVKNNVLGIKSLDKSISSIDNLNLINALDYNVFMGPASFIRTSVYSKIGIYDESLYVEDWDFFLRALDEGIIFNYLNAALVYYRQHKYNAWRKRRLVLESNIKMIYKYKNIKGHRYRIIQLISRTVNGYFHDRHISFFDYKWLVKLIITKLSFSTISLFTYITLIKLLLLGLFIKRENV